MISVLQMTFWKIRQSVKHSRRSFVMAVYDVSNVDCSMYAVAAWSVKLTALSCSFSNLRINLFIAQLAFNHNSSIHKFFRSLASRMKIALENPTLQPSPFPKARWWSTKSYPIFKISSTTSKSRLLRKYFCKFVRRFVIWEQIWSCSEKNKAWRQFAKCLTTFLNIFQKGQHLQA